MRIVATRAKYPIWGVAGKIALRIIPGVVVKIGTLVGSARAKDIGA